MIIGIPKEIRREEYRVGITPQGAADLRKSGHTVLIENSAGTGSGFPDDEYLDADADLVDRETLYAKSDIIIKVKEPLPSEYDLIRDGQTIFTFLHLAPNRDLTDALIRKQVIALGYETLEKSGTLPLLRPMSEIAGRMAPLMGAFYLQKFVGGRGVLPMGTAGVRPARTVILGAGIVGMNAARVSLGLGMDTAVLNRGIERLGEIDAMFLGKVRTLSLTPITIDRELREADIVIGALLVPGGKTPVIITRKMLKTMRRGSVIVDVSIDQGGCAETSKPTTHDNPVYDVDGVIHYAVSNMPGSYPRTSTIALTNATLPYIRLLAEKGIERALLESRELKSSVNVFKGRIVHEAVAIAQGHSFRNVEDLLRKERSI